MTQISNVIKPAVCSGLGTYAGDQALKNTVDLRGSLYQLAARNTVYYLPAPVEAAGCRVTKIILQGLACGSDTLYRPMNKIQELQNIYM